MNLFKDKNQINLIKPKKTSCQRWTKHIRVFVFVLFVLASVASLQNITVNVLANIENLKFTISQLDFGLRFPGEEADKYFTVEFVGTGDPDNYSIATYPKPIIESDKEYCRLNPTDYNICYRDLCDHLAITSMDADDPLDTLGSALVSMDDRLDTWQVHLTTPAITGMVAQDHGYGIVDSAGDYGCDIAIEIEEEITSICGYKFFDHEQDGEMDGDDYGLSGWTINLMRFIGCSEGEKWADTVVASSQGTKKDGDPVKTIRSDPNAATGPAEYDTVEEHFFSLGFGGSIILEFDNYIVNGLGDDIELVEATNEIYPDETVEVFASPDNSTWWYLGEYSKDSLIDLSDYSTSIMYAKYIKLVDTTDPELHNNNADGYDLDGVKAINCAAGWEIIETEITDENGHYCFYNIEAGSYRLEEVLQDGWTATAPVSPEYYDFTMGGDDHLNYNFGNYKEDGKECDPEDQRQCGQTDVGECEFGTQTCESSGYWGECVGAVYPAVEVCDGKDNDCDGEVDEDDVCNGGGESVGGGGGYTYQDLYIFNERATKPSDTSVTVTWTTSKFATSRVIYDTVSHPDISGEVGPNYGYAFSTIEDPNKVTGHSVAVGGLIPDTQYFFRPVSRASPEKYGRELSFTTPPAEDTGEEKEGVDGEDKDEDKEDGVEEGEEGAAGEITPEAYQRIAQRAVDSIGDYLNSFTGEEEPDEEEFKEESEEEEGEVKGEEDEADKIEEDEKDKQDEQDEEKAGIFSEWWWWILLALILIIFFLWYRKRKKEEEEEEIS